jgi:hypothetical protein
MQGKHAKKRMKTGTGALVGAAVGATAAVPAGAFGLVHPAAAQVHVPVQLVSSQAPVHVGHTADHATLDAVVVSAGDTLSAISGELCGTPADYPHLAAGNNIANADMIEVGQTVKKTCDAYVPRHAAAVHATTPVHAAAPVQQASASAPATPAAVPVTTAAAGDYSCSMLVALWEQAGGSSALSETMAGIAMAESGGNPGAVSPTDDFGLWQDHADPAALSPAASASASVTIEETQGLDAWTTYRTGAYAGHC